MMRFTRTWCSIICLLVTGFTFATDRSREILQKTQQAFDVDTPLIAHFSLIEKDAATQSQLHTHGSFIISKERFILDLPDTKTWFDGTTLWTLMKQHQEVNVSTPSPQETISMHPATLIGIYQHGYDHHYKGNTDMLQKKQTQHIVLTTANPQAPFSQIDLWIDAATYFPVQIDLKMPNNQNQTIIFTHIKYDNDRKETDFTFPTSNYKDVDIIDLR